MSPDAEATFHRASCTLGNQVIVLRTALLFVRSAVRLVSAETPGADSGLLLAEARTCEPGITSQSKSQASVLAKELDTAVEAFRIARLPRRRWP